MFEEIMVCTNADIEDNDHGGAALIVYLEAQGKSQAFVTGTSLAYGVMRVFDVTALRYCAGKPIVVVRHEHSGAIHTIKRLPCYDLYEVSNGS